MVSETLVISRRSISPSSLSLICRYAGSGSPLPRMPRFAAAGGHRPLPKQGGVGTSNCDWYRRTPHVSGPQKAAHARGERWGYEWLPGQGILLTQQGCGVGRAGCRSHFRVTLGARR